MGYSSDSWLSYNPSIVVLPLLLWLAARCPPVFAIAGAFIASTLVIWATTYGIGRYGDAAVPILERVKGAQAIVATGTIGILVLTVLFVQRKKAEEGLRQREAELGEAQRVCRIGSWHWDAESDVIVGSDELLRIFGCNPATQCVPTYRDQRGRWYPVDDWKRLKAVMQSTMQTGNGDEVELQAFRNGTPIWITARGEVVRNSTGRIVGLRGTVQDITERKRAELALAERNAQLALAGKAGLVGNYTYDVNKGVMQVSEGYAAIHGLPDGTTETSYSEWRERVHPDDLLRAEGSRDQAFANRWKEDNAEYRIILSTGEVRWIERRGSISYGEDGRPQRVTGVNIDVTERKSAEQHQRALNAELDHRVKNSLATISAVVSHTLNASGSMADFATALEGRVQSMARTHELLSASRWHGISVAELVRRELAPYATNGNTEVNGPEVILRAEAGQVIAMVLHELATNAAKYGALSTQNGCVSIRFRQRPNGHPRSHLVIEWREVGGSSVITPGKPGYGTRTIRNLVPYELRGTVDLAFAPEGIRCRLELPANWLINDGEPVSEAVARAPDE